MAGFDSQVFSTTPTTPTPTTPMKLNWTFLSSDLTKYDYQTGSKAEVSKKHRDVSQVSFKFDAVSISLGKKM
jgi:hypothetical protein